MYLTKVIFQRNSFGKSHWMQRNSFGKLPCGWVVFFVVVVAIFFFFFFGGGGGGAREVFSSQKQSSSLVLKFMIFFMSALNYLIYNCLMSALFDQFAGFVFLLFWKYRSFFVLCYSKSLFTKYTPTHLNTHTLTHTHTTHTSHTYTPWPHTHRQDIQIKQKQSKNKSYCTACPLLIYKSFTSFSCKKKKHEF